jgi:hypothetical protein
MKVGIYGTIRWGMFGAFGIDFLGLGGRASAASPWMEWDGYDGVMKEKCVMDMDQIMYRNI